MTWIVWFPTDRLPAARTNSYGGAKSSWIDTLSTNNFTRTTPTLSVAFAVMTNEPEEMRPSAGDDSVRAGFVTSRTVTATVSVAAFPAASRTVSVTTYVPGVANT